MEASGVGVNSPEFLQKKIERLKTALDEANVLMDRHVTERDEARAQLGALRRENEELKRQLGERGGPAPDGGGEQQATAADPAVEQELRDRIAQLEAERDQLQSGRPDDGGQELRTRIDALQSELDAASRDVETSRHEADRPVVPLVVGMTPGNTSSDSSTTPKA